MSEFTNWGTSCDPKEVFGAQTVRQLLEQRIEIAAQVVPQFESSIGQQPVTQLPWAISMVKKHLMLLYIDVLYMYI